MADGVVEIDVELDSSDAESKGAKLAGNLAKMGAAAGAAIGAATAALTKQALDLYASYEQLVGGVDTLFKESSSTVQQYAANAYQTAGMSSNQYMETVTSFSSSLIKSLGGDTAAAAEYADVAIRDMADNANKMGTSIDVIQQTYASLARGNYAMLDNLKIGYGGTKAELEELLKDAEAYQAAQGNMVDYSIDSYADIVSAIHDVQVAQGIAGATAAEAASTIEGSANAAKAAWENWLTGLGDTNADMSKLTENLANSIITAAKNIIPRVGTIITALVGTMMAAIPDALGDLGETVMPELWNLLSTILEAAPQMAAAGIELVSSLVLGMLESLPRFISTFATSIVSTGLPMLLSSVTTVATGIVSALPGLIWNIVDMVPELIGDVVSSIVGSIPVLVQGFVELFTAFTIALPEILSMLVEELPQIIDTVVDTLLENAPILIAAAFQLFMAILNGLWNAAPNILSGLAELAATIVSKVAELPSRMVEIGGNIVRGLWEGVQNLAGWIWDKITGWAGSLVDAAMDALGINSPSTVMRDKVGRYMAEGVGVGFEKYSPAKDIQETLLTDVTSLGMSARMSYAGNTTTNYFTIERIDAHDMAGVDNVNRLIELFNMNA